jgi:hypothetical protein
VYKGCAPLRILYNCNYLSKKKKNYGSMRGGWCSKEVRGPYGVGVWKCIRRGWDGFAHNVRYEVGKICWIPSKRKSFEKLRLYV